MADDRDARSIAQLEAQLRQAREREPERLAEVAQCRVDLKQALEQQTATAEVLRVIASSPTDVQAVLDEMVHSLKRLGRTDGASIYRAEGDEMVFIASTRPDLVGHRQAFAGSIGGQAFLDGRTIASHGPRDEQIVRFPGSPGARQGTGATAVTPLTSHGRPFGVLGMTRREIRPFSEREIALLETFADQAVIAIENARLFEELQEANSQLAEASQHKSQSLANMVPNTQPRQVPTLTCPRPRNTASPQHPIPPGPNPNLPSPLSPIPYPLSPSPSPTPASA